MLRALLSTYLAILICGLLAPCALAQNEGQDALDKATEKRISAENLADLNEVIQLCEQALKKGLDKDNTEYANNLLTGTLVQRGSLLASAIFDKNPPDPRWPEVRGLAIKDLERAIKIDPKVGEAHYFIARLHTLPGGDLERARKAIDQAVENTKRDKLIQAKSLTLRANLTAVEANPQTDEAKEANKKAIEKRLADYAAAIELAPADNDAVRSRGLFYLTQGQFEKAVEDFDAAIKNDPDEATTHEARGVALLMLKKLDDAKASLSKAIELNADAPLPYVHRARVLQQQGDSKAAREDIEKALKLKPDLVIALELRAIMAANNRDFQQAIKDFEELLKLAPDNAELLAQIGILYQASKQPKAAIEKFSAALERDKSLFAALRGRADSYLGLGKQAEAIADYEEALKMQPKDPGVLNNLAWVLATSPEDKLRDGNRAIELAKTACEVTEFKQAHILSTLAAGYAESGQWDEAVKWSKKAVETGDQPIKEQLEKELASYQDKKPWRERQEMEQGKDEEPTEDDATKGTQSVVKKNEDK